MQHADASRVCVWARYRRELKIEIGCQDLLVGGGGAEEGVDSPDG